MKAGEIFGNLLLVRADVENIENYTAIETTKNTKRRDKLVAYCRVMKKNDEYWYDKRVKRTEIRDVIELSKIRPGLFCQVLFLYRFL